MISEHTKKSAKRISGVPETRSVSEDAQKPPYDGWFLHKVQK